MCDFRYWSPERDSSGSLWYALCRSKKWYIKNIRYSLFLQQKTERGLNIYTTITNLQSVLKIWKMRSLTLEGKIVIFKTLLISKIAFQSMTTPIPKHIVNELEKIHKALLWKNLSPKWKHETLCNDCKGGGLKNIDIWNKIISLYNACGSEDFMTICFINESWYRFS